MATQFKPPTPEELQLQAAKIGLPEREAQKFFNYFDSKGWKVGKVRMQRWKSALANWKLNWEEWRQPKTDVSPTTLAILRRKELDEVMAQMQSIRGSYSEHQSWTQDDKYRWLKFKARRNELKKLLGMQT